MRCGITGGESSPAVPILTSFSLQPGREPGLKTTSRPMYCQDPGLWLQALNSTECLTSQLPGAALEHGRVRNKDLGNTHRTLGSTTKRIPWMYNSPGGGRCAASSDRVPAHTRTDWSQASQLVLSTMLWTRHQYPDVFTIHPPLSSVRTLSSRLSSRLLACQGIRANGRVWKRSINHKRR